MNQAQEFPEQCKTVRDDEASAISAWMDNQADQVDTVGWSAYAIALHDAAQAVRERSYRI